MASRTDDSCSSLYDRNFDISLGSVVNTNRLQQMPTGFGLNTGDLGYETDSFGNQEDTHVVANCWEVDNALILGFRQLLNMYKGQVDDCGPEADGTTIDGLPQDEFVISGGFQQYLIRNRDKLRVETEQPRKGNGSSCTTFHDLPVS